MSRKPKFNPEITRVKLNPEQAVLFCLCYTGGLAFRSGAKDASTPYCLDGTPRTFGPGICRPGAALAGS